MNHMILNGSGRIDYEGDYEKREYESVRYRGYWIEETDSDFEIILRGKILDRVADLDEAKQWIDITINEES